ncbi:hypothetical protein [Archangium lansingense]|uniref:Uncharacterized protein n=1 Tax=Archangium lansingense TaxID=2995310 RepID=A0ABT4AD51_9BACT|nr:hypothetical protein [Archangium lansinium]MCY1079602.1 hypothetical protein [Archangium lansinium]
MKKNQATRRDVMEALSRLPELTEGQARAVTGGASNIYYDVSTGTYIVRPAGSVYVGPGLLVGNT